MHTQKAQENRLKRLNAQEDSISITRKRVGQSDINELVRMVAEGDHNAESQICRFFLNRYKTYFLKKGYPLAAVEDAIQEAMISLIAILRRDGLINYSAASTYFVNSVKYQLWQHARNASKYSEFNEQSNLLATEPDCFEKVKLQRELTMVVKAIEKLKHERDRQILLRRFIQSQSIEQICRDFSLERNHFYRVLYRARHRLSQLVA